MTLDVETPPGVKDEGPAGRPARARARMPQAARWALVLVACALLAAGAYYAWRTGFGQDSPADGFITAVAQRGDLEDTVTAIRYILPRSCIASMTMPVPIASSRMSLATRT